jgi:hypothetical protein
MQQAMRAVVPVVLLACLSACESHMAGSLVYMTPYNIDRLDCDELNRRIATAAAAAKAKQDLIDRASGSVAGPAITTVVHGPEHGQALYQLRLYQEEAARKNCVASPLAVLPPPGGPAPGNRLPPPPPAAPSRTPAEEFTPFEERQ